MRGLFNIATKSPELRIKILSELGFELTNRDIKDLDPVIKTYIFTLLSPN